MKQKIAYTINGLVGGLSGKNSERKNEDLLEDIVSYSKSTIDYSFSEYDVDFYIFSWHHDKGNLIDKIFQPKLSIHTKQLHFNDIPQGIDNDQRTQNHLSRWFSFIIVTDLVYRSGITYDYVMNSRFDVCWNNKFNFDKRKVTISRYIGDNFITPEGIIKHDYDELFNIDKWDNQSLSDKIQLKDLADHVFGCDTQTMKLFSEIANGIKKLHLEKNGRGSMMSHHRLLPAILKKANIKQNDINYLHHYNGGGLGCGDYDILRYRNLTGEMIKMNNKIVNKPWGSYENLATQENFNLKKLIISPGHQPSYQYHHKRAEHWIVLSGEGEVTIDDSVRTCKKNDCIFIPIGSKHRIKNTSQSDDLVFIEVQTGTYFGEDDIVRLQDDYSRTT